MGVAAELCVCVGTEGTREVVRLKSTELGFRVEIRAVEGMMRVWERRKRQAVTRVEG